MKKINFIFAVLSLMMLVMYSCNSENPVKPDGLQLDTARFNWQEIEMYYFTGSDRLYSFWSPDTNEVFMCSISNYLVHFKDGQFVELNYGPNIQMYSIDGISPTEGYIVGGELKNGIFVPHIERWNGSSFLNVPIQYNFEGSFLVSDIFIKSSTEMWFSSPYGIVYNFDGYNLTRYKLKDSTMYSIGFLYDENNRLNYLTEFFNSGIDTLHRSYVYEFDGQSWVKVYTDIYPLFHKGYSIMNNFICAYRYPTTLYKLQNNILNPVINMPNDAGIYGLCGNSLNNIMGYGYTEGRKSFFHWNGQKWSDEKAGNEGYDTPIMMKMINDNYVCAIRYGFYDRAFLSRGYKKH